MDKKMPREMTGAELRSMLKSSINLKSLGGVKCEELNLSKEDKKWWKDAKIGMFIHWGLYSALGKGEWAKYNLKIDDEEYNKLSEELLQEDFNAEEWVEIAKDFGANYSVMVTKHHDGFALWGSKGSYNDFNSCKMPPHRDVVREFVDGCRKNNLAVGLYYSPMDWRFPGYFDPEGLPENASLMKKQCYSQVEELCRDYGPLDILWYDGAWLAHKGSDTTSAWFWEPSKLNKMARKYNPKMMINPRSGWEGDFYCDEGSHEITGQIMPVLWEKNMCVCSGSSWGWMKEDPVSDFNWLIKMMINTVCRGGNWLVNIGPDKNGKISKEIRNRMKEVGDWLREYGESVYATEGGPIEPIDNVYGTTFKENKVYLHILDEEKFKEEQLPLMENKLKNIKTFQGEAVDYSISNTGIKINLDKINMESPDRILILEFENDIEFEKVSEIYFTGK
ncbi:MAG: alpha-L-fucosidase [Lachnospirales bacterium]